MLSRALHAPAAVVGASPRSTMARKAPYILSINCRRQVRVSTVINLYVHKTYSVRRVTIVRLRRFPGLARVDNVKMILISKCNNGPVARQNGSAWPQASLQRPQICKSECEGCQAHRFCPFVNLFPKGKRLQCSWVGYNGASKQSIQL